MTAVTTLIQTNKLPAKLLNKFRLYSTNQFARQMSNCVFCKIISGDSQAEVYFEDEEMLIFKDIKPASKFHLLAIPKQHIVNVNSLTKGHIGLLNKLINTSKEVLSRQGADVSDVRLGFHVPPFNSVSHLHVHVICPASEMSTISRLIFKPHTWWFASVEQILEKLGNSKL